MSTHASSCACRAIDEPSSANPATTAGADSSSDESDSESDSDGDAKADAPDAAGKRKRASGQKEPAASKFGVASPKYIKPSEALALLHAMWVLDGDFLDLLFQCMGGGERDIAAPAKQAPRCNADVFFIRSCLVPPNRFRPMSEMNGMKFQHSHNVILVKVLQSVLDLNDLESNTLKRRAQAAETEDTETVIDPVQSFLRLTLALQNHVRFLFLSSWAYLGSGCP